MAVERKVGDLRHCGWDRGFGSFVPIDSVFRYESEQGISAIGAARKVLRCVVPTTKEENSASQC